MGKKDSNLNLLVKVKQIKIDNNINYLTKNLFLRVIRGKDVSLDYIKWMNDLEITKYTE